MIKLLPVEPLNPVWIVMKNGKIDEVFSSCRAAMNHVENLKRGWNLTEIIQKDLKDL